MKKYISYLLKDIQAATRPVDYFEKASPQINNEVEKKINEIENWINQARSKENSFSDYCGLKREIFPPMEKLEKSELIRICRAFEQLLKSWNAELHLPNDIPLKLRYKLTISTLDEDFYPIEGGWIGFDFCTGDTSDCSLGRFCSCL